MRRKTFLLLCIAFITLFIGISPLQAGHYYYKQISLKDGLPTTVRCILTDEQGFVWIGTRSGLGRYDGHQSEFSCISRFKFSSKFNPFIYASSLG